MTMLPHRAVKALNRLTRQFPNLGRTLNYFLQDRDWPPYVLLPMGGWYAIASEQLAEGGPLSLQQTEAVSRLAAIGAWRYSQGIYRIEPELMNELIASPIEGVIPSEVLHRLPEWSIYIETPGFTYFTQPLYGFWAHLEEDANDGHEELRLLLDTDRSLQPIPLHLGGDIQSAIKGFLATARQYGELPEEADATLLNMKNKLSSLVSLVLYLCAEEPEISGEQSGDYPSYPKPTKVKGGWAIFPPKAPHIWRVGQHIAERLRQAKAEGTIHQQTGKTLRPHLRRGHWHGYWTGPRKGDNPQKFVLRWLHPLIVGKGNAEEEEGN